MGFGIRSILLPEIPYDDWVPLHVAGQRPSARYKHAAAIVCEKLYIVGGSRNGRSLSDIQILDLGTSTWSEMKLNQDKSGVKAMDAETQMLLPPIADHSLVKWNDKLLVVAGNAKEFTDNVSVWSIDPLTSKCIAVKTHGEVPFARGGQSVTLVGSKLFMFGGEDAKRHLLNDLHILDLETMCWKLVETRGNIPAARFNHTAAVHADRYLLIFGGGSYSTCFSDLYILDLHTMEWFEPQDRDDSLNSRAGHAGSVLDGGWYIVGGGDNKSGAMETIKLNMSKLTWSVTTRVSQRDPLASEGLSLCSGIIDGEKILIAFGGYNGKYQNEVSVLKIKPSVMAPPPRILQSSAAAAAAASVSAAYALASTDAKQSRNLKETDTIMEIEDQDLSQTGPETSLSIEKNMLQSSITDAIEENKRLEDALKELKSSHKELSRELESVQGQLEAETSRCAKLELQVARIRTKLESQHSLEHELEVLHQQRSSKQDYGEADRQNSGVWTWMRGAATRED